MRDWEFLPGKLLTWLPKLLKGYPWYRTELPKLILAYSTLATSAWAPGPDIHSTIRRTGMLIVPRDWALSVIGDAIDNSRYVTQLAELFPLEAVRGWEASDVLAAVSALPVLEPVPIDPFVGIANQGLIYLDFVAGSDRLVRLLTPFSAGDSISAIRAKDFEVALQSQIDETTWAPPKALRDLVGRRLRVPDGSDLTDVDALAFRDGVGLFIDAKSYVRPESTSGDWRATRNIRTDLEKAWEDWQLLVAALESEPVGRNYDFSRCGRFVPLLATPAPYYVHENLLEPKIFGVLHPASSHQELLDYLERGRD